MKIIFIFTLLIATISLFVIYNSTTTNDNNLQHPNYMNLSNDDDGEDYYNVRFYSPYLQQYLTRSLEESSHEYSFPIEMEEYDYFNFDQIFNSTIAWNGNRYISQSLYNIEYNQYFDYELNFYGGDSQTYLVMGSGAELLVFKNKEVEGEFFLYTDKLRKWFCGNEVLDRNDREKCSWKMEEN